MLIRRTEATFLGQRKIADEWFDVYCWNDYSGMFAVHTVRDERYEGEDWSSLGEAISAGVPGGSRTVSG